jgi:DNA-binding MarR family transcriptional regulator
MAARRLDDQALTEELAWLIPRTRRVVWNRAQSRLEHQGSSMFVWLLLRRTIDVGPVSQLELARLTSQHPAAVSRSMDVLERRGLVTRTRDHRDRRRLLVRATPRGRTYCFSLLPEVHVAVDEALGPLSASERARLRDLLLKLVAAADDEPARRSGR